MYSAHTLTRIFADKWLLLAPNMKFFKKFQSLNRLPTQDLQCKNHKNPSDRKSRTWAHDNQPKSQSLTLALQQVYLTVCGTYLADSRIFGPVQFIVLLFVTELYQGISEIHFRYLFKSLLHFDHISEERTPPSCKMSVESLHKPTVEDIARLKDLATKLRYSQL